MILLTRLLTAWQSFTAGSSATATPAVTAPQQLALGQAVIVVLIVLGFNLDPDTQKILLGLSAAIGAALPVADAVVRHGRSSNAPAVVDAQKQEAALKQAATDGGGTTVMSGASAAAGTTGVPAPPAPTASPHAGGEWALTPAQRAAILERLVRLSARRPAP